nr:hypothetical protein [Thetidibacter halocola]
MSDLETRGWIRLSGLAGLSDWTSAAHDAALKVVADPVLRDRWLECEGTWFVGVDALPTGPDGGIGGVALPDSLLRLLPPLPPLHPAQLSVVYPGYPRPRRGESAAGFAYRRDRCAAHVDGIIAEGEARRRFVTEPHGFVLGLPLNVADPGAAPLTVWEGSHSLIRNALAGACDAGQGALDNIDVTEVYQAARRLCFKTCPRVALHAEPGEALLLHRHLLHGIAPWQDGAKAPPEGRMIAYFRPLARGGHAVWIDPAPLV